MSSRKMRATGLALMGALGCGRLDTPGPKPAQCVIAHVGDIPVLTSEADILRAMLQPPPTAEQARRLAVAATAYYRQVYPHGDLPPIESRLAWYRERVSRSRSVDFTAAPVKHGPCWAGEFDGSGLSARSSELHSEHARDSLSSNPILFTGEPHG